ncbi:MAG: hypothetical protein KDD58_10895, partial [Bdellovibrionales bacterium]|nr:hypothetical protein [Bdellovibrionales bacterium]
MANIIIIEDDERVTREMTRFLREQNNDNQIRHFKSSEQFIKRYSGTNRNEDLTKNEQSLGLAYYNVDELKQMDSLDFTDQEPFAGEHLKMVLSLPELTPLKISINQPGQVFQLEIDKIIGNKNIFNLLIPEEFKKHWVSCQENIMQSKNSGQCHFIFPLKNAKQTWLLSAKFYNSTKDQIEVTFDNLLLTEKGRSTLKREINNRADTAAKELDMLSYIDLIIVKNGLVEADTRDWVSATRAHLKENNFFPQEKTTRFIVTKYEDDGVSKSTLFHQYIDDLITLPLDRLLFLQKIDIILNLPNVTKPRFLFLQPLQKQIELSKKTRLENFNDLSISITNPIALRAGLASTFFFNFPNQEEPIR